MKRLGGMQGGVQARDRGSSESAADAPDATAQGDMRARRTRHLKPGWLALVAMLCCPAVAMAAGAGAPPKKVQPGVTQNVKPLFPGPPHYLDPYGYIMPFGSDSYIKFGGSARVAYLSFKNPGIVGALDNDQYHHSRFEVNANAHFGQVARLYVQVGWSGQQGKEGRVTPVDKSGAELQQAFLDVFLPNTDGRGWLRVGRQSLAIDRGHWTTTRLVPNVLFYLDGARLHYALNRHTTFDAFALKPVQPQQGPFNDGTRSRDMFYGFYAKVAWNKHFHEDFFALDHDGFTLPMDGMPPAHEQRHGFGSRFYGGVGNFHYDVDFMYQIGTFQSGVAGNLRIRAWGLFSSYGFTFKHAMGHPDISFVLDASSGDSNPNDGTLGTFWNFYTAYGKWWGNGGYTALSNLTVSGLSFRIAPTRKWHFTAKAMTEWRRTSSDCIYVPPTVPIRGTCGAPGGDHIGSFFDATARWIPNAHVYLDFEYEYFSPQGALEAVGGDNSQYFATRLTLLF